MVDFTIFFDGTLNEFVNFAEEVRHATMDDEGRSIVSWAADQPQTNPFKRVLLFHPKGTPDVAGRIHVIGGFDPSIGKTDETLLSITIEEETFDDVWPIWEALKDELDKKDLLIGEPIGSFGVPKRSETERPKQAPQSKVGRPRDPHYEWARKQIYELNRNKAEVYKEWLERIPAQRRESFANPWDSFKKGMRKKPE